MMRIVYRLLWIAAFVLATYCWMVAFEHGLGWKEFLEGFRSEWRNVADLLIGKNSPRP